MKSVSGENGRFGFTGGKSLEVIKMPKKIKKSEKLFGVPKKEDANRAVKYLADSIRHEEEELVLYDDNFVKDLAEIIKILEGKNGN